MLRKTKALLLTMFLLGATACGGTATTLDADDFSVWCVDSTVSIRKEDTSYAGEKQSKLTFSCVKNEYESAQIMITAKENIRKYSLSLADLSCGEEVLSKENFQIYREHYIEVEEVDQRDSTPYPTGYYPDGLIPFALAEDAGELTVKKDDNQGIWVTVYIPKTTKAGVYTGSFTLSADGVKKSIPVEVEVYDSQLSDESTMQTLFLMRSDFAMTYGELDCTPEMMRTYYDFLLDYRLNAYNIPIASYNDVSYFVEAVKEYYDNPKVTTYGLPASTKGNGGVPYADKAKEQILALAKECTKGTNYLSKLVMKNADETDYLEELNKGTFNSDLIANRKLRAELAAAAEIVRVNEKGEYDGYIANFASVEEAALAIERLPIVDPLCYPTTYIAAHNDRSSREGELLTLMNVWCPKTDILVDEYRELVFEAAENYDATMWWYTANNPRWPTPTYHIDNNPVGAQALSWMQRDYGITGNLYWAVTSVPAGDDVYNDVDFPAGDGCFLYPGAKYNHYGPLPSMRLMHMRDGMEDYELLGALEEKYQAFATEHGIVDYDKESVFDLLYSRIYSGVYLYDEPKAFAEVSKELRTLLSEDLSETGFFIANVNRQAQQTSVVFYAKDNAISATNVTKTGTAGTLTQYTYTPTDTSTAQYLRLTTGGKTYNRYVSGVYANFYETKKSEYVKDTDYKLQDGDTASSVTLEDDGMHVNVAGKFTGNSTEDLIYTPYVQLSAKAFNVDKFSVSGGRTLHLNIYNPTEEEIKVKIYLIGGGARKEYGSVTLARGRVTDVAIYPDKLNWAQENKNNITAIRFETDNMKRADGTAKVTTVIIQDCYIR